MREADVAVVGAGLAGLTAARELKKAGVSAVVAEARDRVGGRTLNHDIGGGKVVEVGGQWVGPTQHRMLALAKEVGVPTFPTYAKGWNRVEWRGRMRRYRGTFPWISPAALVDALQAQQRLDRMAREVPLDAPWLAPKAEEWDSQTLWSWMQRGMATEPGRQLLQLGTESVWAAQPGDLSLLHFLFYANSAGGLDALWDTAGGAQDARFVGGSQRVSLEMAKDLDVELSSAVRFLEHGPDGVTLRTDSGPIRARRVVIAIPPTLTSRISYDPPLPAARDQLVQRMPQGSAIKCMAVYPEPFWRADGFSGQSTSLTGPVKLTFDNSPPDGSPGVLLGFLEGRQARDLARLPAEERRRLVVGCFERFFGPRAASPEQYVERVWADEEFTRGCYGCYMPPGGWTAFGDQLREPIGPIHWASAETALVWNGYMDGAVSSGERAARQVLDALAQSPGS